MHLRNDDGHAPPEGRDLDPPTRRSIGVLAIDRDRDRLSVLFMAKKAFPSTLSSTAIDGVILAFLGDASSAKWKRKPIPTWPVANLARPTPSLQVTTPSFGAFGGCWRAQLQRLETAIELQWR